jgi:hypothetical protein
MFKARKEVEELVYKTLDIVDPTEQNSAFYKAKFAKMTDDEFMQFFKQDFAIKFQMKLFEIEPKINQISKALDNIGVPLMEKINLPFIYKNKDGVPVKSEEALVIYNPMKKMKQFISKKNSMSTNISKRDMKTGLLLDIDKNGNTSDREMECLAVMGLDATINELSTYRADAMEAKTEFYNTINTTGMVSQKDIKVSKDDSLSRNLLNTYLIGAGLNSNLINEEDYLLYTLKGKERKTQREV